MTRALDTIAVLMPLPARALERMRAAFKTVHYAPPGPDVPAKRLSPEAWADVDVMFCDWPGPPKELTLAEAPRLRHVQLPTAGLDGALANSKLVQELAAQGPSADAPTVSTASGIHVLTIPNWVVGMTIALYQQHHVMARIAREQQHWASEMEVDPRGKFYNRSLWGRTAGMLGYGALGRETARLLKAHGMRVIAANSSGEASKFEDWTPEGTGDLDGSIPEKCYSVKDAGQFEQFLRDTDVLVCSLPGTPATRHLLDASKLALLKPEALFINVGRGTLISSEELLKALDSEALFGAAIDVADPEPLPDGHALLTHAKCIVTPHLSGHNRDEEVLGADLAIENAERIRRGERPFNVADLGKGY